ncbi:MAG: hypothetical protein VKK62_10350 [Synechococcaceae cyanobacterium]|nr:hypothetical protein [Synechococcaceae cyanobacterium]
MADPLPPQAFEVVLLHQDTGAVLYSTRATQAELQRANGAIRRAGQRLRFVAARHLGHQPREQTG